MALAAVLGVERCRWIPKGQRWPNCPETRANAGKRQVTAKMTVKIFEAAAIALRVNSLDCTLTIERE
jgi:hypothetical protein